MIERLKEENGYSLVEVMVSIVILSIAIIPMVSMFDMGLKTAVLGGNYDKGRALANEKLEEIKALDYSQVQAKYPTPGTSQPPDVGIYKFEVITSYCKPDLSACNEPSGSYIKVDVKVLWDNGNKEFNTTGLKVR